MTDNNCLLIIPPFTSGRGSILKSFEYSMPPLGLLSIASWLRKNGVKVSLLDFTIEDTAKLSFDEIIETHIKEFGEPNWIGISVCTPVSYSAYNVSDLCKKLYPNSMIVLGGPHVTVLHDKIFDECNSADYLITGEGEFTLNDLITKNDTSPSNLFIRDADKDREIIKAKTVDLSVLEMPAFDLLKFDKYTPPPASIHSKHPGIGIITSRGCPFQCTFCAKTAGSNLRFIPIPKVIEQIKYLQAKFGIQQFHFYDDTITCRKEYIVELCKTMLEEKLDLHWSCFARVDTVDEEILTYMKKAGCFVVMYGAESMDEGILKSVKKGITVPQIKKALELTSKVKIESRVSVIIGTPNETKETIDKTKKEILKLNTDFLQVFIAIPMPGSQFYIDAKKEDRVISENWEDYNLSKVLYKHPVFSEKELFKIQRNLYLSFYLRPKIIFKYISRINSFNALKNILRGFSGFIKIIFS